MRHAVRITAELTLVVAGLIAGLFLVELGCRLAGYTTPVITDGHGMAPRFYYKADPINGHDIAENFSDGFFQLPDYIRSHGAPFAVSSNSLGCRDRPIEQGSDYVLLLGDSLTWGYVPLEQTWGATLQQHIGVRVLNCGVGGYGPRHERRKMEVVVGRAGRPRLVIVGYTVGNDLTDDYLYPGRTVIDGYMVNKVTLTDPGNGDRTVSSDEQLQAQLKSFLEPMPAGLLAGWKSLLAEHSVLYDRLRNWRALRHLASRLGMADPPPPPSGLESFSSVTASPWLDQAWEEHLHNILQLKSSVEGMGANLLVVIIPLSAQVYESLRPQGSDLDWEYPNKRLTECFRQEHIAYLDMMSEFQRYAHRTGPAIANRHEDLYWRDDGHLNVEGNRLAGLLISRYVLEQKFLALRDEDKRLSDVRQLLRALIDVAPVQASSTANLHR